MVSSNSNWVPPSNGPPATKLSGASSQQNRGLTEMLQDSLTNLNLPHPPTNGTLPPTLQQQPVTSQTHTSHAASRPQLSQGIPHGVPQGVLLALPAWMQGKGAIPPLYQQVSTLCADPRQSYYILTDRIQPVLLSSKLDKEKLKQIWSICNKTVPGVLTLTECYTVLGLIALAQQGHGTDLDLLASFSFVPIPALDLAPPLQVPVRMYPQGANVPPLPVTNTSMTVPNGLPMQQTFKTGTIVNPTAKNIQNAKTDTSFGDFQSAAIAKSSPNPIDSEFGELKSAPAPPPSSKLDISIPSLPNLNPTLPPTAAVSPLETPPLLPPTDARNVSEDKYSCFRDIGTSDAPASVSSTLPLSVFSGGTGMGENLVNSDDVTDKYAYLRVLDESSDQKSEPLITDKTSNNSQPVMRLSDFEILVPQTQSKDLSLFEQSAANINHPSNPSTTRQDSAGKFPNDPNPVEFSDFTHFTCPEASTTKTDSITASTDFFDLKDFSVFQSASNNPTYILSGLELTSNATGSKERIAIPTNPPPPVTNINRISGSLTEFSSQTAAVPIDSKSLLSDLMGPGKNNTVTSDTSTVPVPILEPQTKGASILDELIPFQSSAPPPQSNLPLDIPVTYTPLLSDNNTATVLNPREREMSSGLLTTIPRGDFSSDKKYDGLDFDIFHTAVPTTNSNSVLIPTSIQPAATSDPVLIPTSIQPTATSDPVLIPTGIQSSTASDPVLIPTGIQSSTASDPVLIPTGIQSSTTSDPVLIPTGIQSNAASVTTLLTEPPPLDGSDNTQNGDTSNISVAGSEQKVLIPKFDEARRKGEFSLLNGPPPMDDVPADEHSEEIDVYNFSGFHSSLPDGVCEPVSQRREQVPGPADSANPASTKNTFPTLSAANLPHNVDVETEQDAQPSDATPIAPPSDADHGEKTPLAVPGAASLTEQAGLGDENLQDFVFNEIPLLSNLEALPSNSNTNSFHTASQPLNTDPEQESSKKETTPTDSDPFDFLSSLQANDLMKGKSPKLAQPKWTLFDTFSNALQDINSVPIDSYKNQKFQTNKEASGLSYGQEAEFESFKSAAGTKDTGTAHKPLAKAPSYKLSEEPGSELKDAWSHLVSACSAVVHTCLEKVKSATSVHVLKELCSHQKSRQYFEAVFEVMKIVCRVQKQIPPNWEVHNLALDDTALDWANVKAYLNHGGLQFSDIPTEGPKGGEPPHCGVCMDSIGEGECRIAFGGYDYHNTCANFWLNEVRNMLPRLKRES